MKRKAEKFHDKRTGREWEGITTKGKCGEYNETVAINDLGGGKVFVATFLRDDENDISRTHDFPWYVSMSRDDLIEFAMLMLNKAREMDNREDDEF